MKWWDLMPLSFKPAFSLSSFTFIKRLFSSSLLSAIRVVSSAYLRLLIFLSVILIPAWTSSQHLAWCKSVYKLNKHGDNIQPWCMPFPTLNQFIVPCLVLTVTSWPAYRFLRIITLSEKRQTRKKKKKKDYILNSFIYKTPENKLIYSGRKQLSGGLRLEWSDNVSILICFFSHLYPWPFTSPPAVFTVPSRCPVWMSSQGCSLCS